MPRGKDRQKRKSRKAAYIGGGLAGSAGLLGGGGYLAKREFGKRVMTGKKGEPVAPTKKAPRRTPNMTLRELGDLQDKRGTQQSKNRENLIDSSREKLENITRGYREKVSRGRPTSTNVRGGSLVRTGPKSTSSQLARIVGGAQNTGGAIKRAAQETISSGGALRGQIAEGMADERAASVGRKVGRSKIAKRAAQDSAKVVNFLKQLGKRAR